MFSKGSSGSVLIWMLGLFEDARPRDGFVAGSRVNGDLIGCIGVRKMGISGL